MLYTRFYSALFLICAFSAWNPAIAAAEAGNNVTLAVFAKQASGFEFKQTLQGDFSTLITSQKGATPLLISHARNVTNSNVINLQQDVLRDTLAGLSDVGIDCQLTFFEKNKALKIGGICDVLDSLKGNSKGIIPMVSLPVKSNIWAKLFEDKEKDIAIYASTEAFYLNPAKQ